MSLLSQVDPRIVEIVLSGGKASVDDLEYAEAHIAEVNPEVYLLAARIFIQRKIFDQRLSNLNDESNVTNLCESQSITQLKTWFLSNISYVLQRLVDEYGKNTVPFRRAVQDFNSIISIIANSGICIEDHYSTPWSLSLIVNIRLEMSKSNLNPNSIFDIEDKIQATRWSLPRRCIFSLNSCMNDFRSTASIKKYLKEVVNPESFTHLKAQLFPLADRKNKDIIRVNWLPYAEQIPFSFFFCLVSLIIDTEIEFVPVAFNSTEINPLIENQTLTAAVINTTISSERKIEAFHNSFKIHIEHKDYNKDYLCSDYLLRYEGYDALVTLETLESLRANKQLDVDCSDKELLMEILIESCHKVKFWSPALEFTHALDSEHVALAGACEKKLGDIGNFLIQNNALAMGGSIQLKYLHTLYPTKTILLEKAFASSAEAFIVSTSVDISKVKSLGFNDAISEVWSKALELTDTLFKNYENDKTGFITEISKDFSHDISVYSEDVIISDFKQLKEAYQTHTSEINTTRKQTTC